jgi:hypothetical protein
LYGKQSDSVQPDHVKPACAHNGTVRYCHLYDGNQKDTSTR